MASAIAGWLGHLGAKGALYNSRGDRAAKLVRLARRKKQPANTHGQVRWQILVIVAIAAKILLALHVGMSCTPDSVDYERIGNAIVSGGVLAKPIDLHVKPRADFIANIAFRMIGYPSVISIAKILLGKGWLLGILILQVTGSLVTCFLIYEMLRVLSFQPVFALGAAIFYGVSPVLDLDQAVLTDSLYASLVSCFAIIIGTDIVLNRPMTVPKALCIGLLLAVAMMLREATQFLALSFLPLAALWSIRTRTLIVNRLMLVLALFLPLVVTVASYCYWHELRSGKSFVTTTAQFNAFASLFETEAYRQLHHPAQPSVFNTNGPVDTVARQAKMDCRAGTADADRVCAERSNASRIVDLNLRLSKQFGLDSLEIAEMATQKYLSLWRTRPGLMLGSMAGRAAIALTVLRPLDLRFAFESPPLDITVLKPIDFSSKAKSPSCTENLNRDSAGRRYPWALHIVYVLGKVMAVIIFVSSLIAFVWTTGAVALGAMFFRHREASLQQLVVVAFGVVVWGFLFFYAAVHMESRFMQPVAPLMLISFLIAARDLWRHCNEVTKRFIADLQNL